MEKTYEPLGVYNAKKVLTRECPGWTIEQQDGYYFVMYGSTVLSPLCTGPHVAIRFAAIMISFTDAMDSTTVDSETGVPYVEKAQDKNVEKVRQPITIWTGYAVTENEKRLAKALFVALAYLYANSKRDAVTIATAYCHDALKDSFTYAQLEELRTDKEVEILRRG